MRTLTQNKALHLYFKMLADEFGEKGLDMKKTLKAEIEIPWDEDSVKKHLWKPLQKLVLETESTTKLETKHVGQIYDILNRHLIEKLDIAVPFPHREA